MKIFIVKKLDISDPRKKEFSKMCDLVSESDTNIGFVPKEEFKVSFGVVLTENGISYQLAVSPELY